MPQKTKAVNTWLNFQKACCYLVTLTYFIRKQIHNFSSIPTDFFFRGWYTRRCEYKNFPAKCFHCRLYTCEAKISNQKCVKLFRNMELIFHILLSSGNLYFQEVKRHQQSIPVFLKGQDSDKEDILGASCCTARIYFYHTLLLICTPLVKF